VRLDPKADGRLIPMVREKKLQFRILPWNCHAPNLFKPYIRTSNHTELQRHLLGNILILKHEIRKALVSTNRDT